MPTNETTARRYRDRARELRAIASTLDREEHRPTLLQAADEYEKMAERLIGDRRPDGEQPSNEPR